MDGTQVQALERERAVLAAELLAWMGEGVPGGPADEQRFNRLALRVFTYQFAANVPYRRFCERRGVRPADVRDWRDVPAVATDAFKEAPLTCFPPEQAAVVFVTSGTTRGAHGRGRHYLRGLELYHASLLPNFTAHLLPDGARLPAVILGFSPDAMPQSSLSHMFGVVEAALTPQPPLPRGEMERGVGLDSPATASPPRGDGRTYFLGPEGVDLDGAEHHLAALAEAGQSVLLMGTAFAFVHVLDHLAARGRRLTLPPGSRLMDTGGYKGRSREVPKEELYGLYGDLLGIPDDHVVNEYGMTEMGSQFYDGVLRAAAASPAAGRPAGASIGPRSLAVRPRRKTPPPWVRTLVVDPNTLAPLPPGQTGVLRHIDLANLDSVMALQTADLGFADEHGFEITGRATGAEARGCSLAVEELLLAQQDR